MPQTYGIPTYDTLFKYVLSQDNIRPSFFHAFVPGLTITSSRRLDGQIQTPEVLQAFERAKLSSMPMGVKEDYDDEDSQYNRYSQHTAAEVAKGLLKCALGMKKLNIPTDQIVMTTGLSAAEVDEIKVDDQQS